MATLPPASEALKIKSVKELPQTRQVPRMYDRSFTSVILREDHMVTTAIRTDISTLYAILVSYLGGETPPANVVDDMLADIASLQSQVNSLSARVSALENSTPEEPT